MATPVAIEYNGVKLELDLDGYTPNAILEKNYKGESYISIGVVREIARAMGRSIEAVSVIHDKIDENIMFTAHATINLGGDVRLVGTANDMYGAKGLARSCFPNAARMQALAIKNALKWKYKIFEGDYLTEEQLAEKRQVQGVSDVATPKDSPFNGLKDSINKTPADKLSEVMKQIVSASGAGLLKPEEAKELRKLYNEKIASSS